MQNTSYKGRFFFPCLARQCLTETLILHGGNLKVMAEGLDVSYRYKILFQVI